jgi:hypothetical protein
LAETSAGDNLPTPQWSALLTECMLLARKGHAHAGDRADPVNAETERPLMCMTSALAFASGYVLIRAIRHGEATAADGSGMQRFLHLSHRKAQWIVEWLRSLRRKPDPKPPVIAGNTGAVAQHIENAHALPINSGSSAMNATLSERPHYEIRFQSLYNEGRALTFPCDEQGHVEMDELSERARLNYLYARAVVGREFAAPAVRLAELH